MDNLQMLGKSIKSDLIQDPILCRRVYIIFMELALNVKLYSAYNSNDDDRVGDGQFFLAENPDNYRLIVGNLIRTEQLEILRNKVEQIQGMDRRALRQYKQELWGYQRTDGKEGGNIGLVEVALKSDNNLEVLFDEVDEHYCYYTISVTISKENTLYPN